MPDLTIENRGIQRCNHICTFESDLNSMLDYDLAFANTASLYNHNNWNRGRRAGRKVIERELKSTHQIKSVVTHCRPERKFTTPSLLSRNPNCLIDLTSGSRNTGTVTSTSVLGSKSNFATWNARSLSSKISSVCDLVLTENVDILCITETWLKGDSSDNFTVANLDNCLKDHKFWHSPRTNSKGGGVGVILRKGFSVSENPKLEVSSFEFIDLTVKSGATTVRLVTIYRPPPSKKNKLTTSLFLQEFSLLLESLACSSGNLLITGDFNFHVDVIGNHEATQFLDLLDTFGLNQHVTEPTHRCGHTLDLVICRQCENQLISVVKVSHSLPSDHAAVICRLQAPRPVPTRVATQQRKLRDIDIDRLCSDILNSPLITQSPDNTDLSMLADMYDYTLRTILDNHAPVKSRQITLRPHAPWYNDSLKDMKQEKRRLERKWKSSKLEIHHQIYKAQCRKYHEMLNNAKSFYHQNEIANCDNKELFKMVDKMANPVKKRILPSSDNLQSLSMSFAEYFQNKVDALRTKIDKTVLSSLPTPERSCECSLSIFQPVTAEQLKKIIQKSPSKTCALDPLPTFILKNCLDDLLPIITHIINLSLHYGSVPTTFKRACISPIIKKPTLDPNVFSNYRPVSNLSFISKVMEKVVATQLHQYLDQNGLYTKMQSAYRRTYSCETALLRVQNDLLLAIDKGKEAILILLDFSSAFDTIDHEQLLDRLQHRFGIQGTPLSWLKSYLHLRSQVTTINGCESSSYLLKHGVPQGSVLGPILFTLYVSPLEDIIIAHDINPMMYADDSQLYLMFNKGQTDVPHKMEACIKDIKDWATRNKLMLNDSKTEVIQIFSRFREPSVFPGIKIEDSQVHTVPEARDLGVIMDKNMSLTTHVKNICKRAFQAIRTIGKIRHFLDQATAERLVHAFITSLLDCCNSLLYGLPTYQLDKLQRVQNTAARLVTRTKGSAHITPILRKLHWLTIPKRITFKVLTLTYKALNNLAPAYISELVNRYQPARNLRSSSMAMLNSPPSKTSTYGDRAFAVAAPKLWNTLPRKIREAESLDSFKSQLKTFLF